MKASDSVVVVRIFFPFFCHFDEAIMFSFRRHNEKNGKISLNTKRFFIALLRRMDQHCYIAPAPSE